MKKISLVTMMLSLSTLTHAGPTGLFEPDTKWEKKNISVCWGDASNVADTRLIRAGHRDIKEEDVIPFTTEQKENIKSIINQEYTKDATGIHFVGWEDCANEALEYDSVLLRIEKPQTSYGKASLGENGEARFSERGTKLVKFNSHHSAFVMINTYPETRLKISQDDFLKITALHEFGHLGGLRHEHARIKEARADKNCRLAKVRLGETEFLSSKKNGPYDSNSIMNYCYINNIAFRTGLDFETNAIDQILILKDPSLYTKTQEGNLSFYSIGIKLSEGDKKSLKKLYK